MSHYSKTWKNCSTCEFWAGPRKPDTFRDGVEVDNAAKGECTGKTWNRSQRSANSSSCSDWRPWGVFR